MAHLHRLKYLIVGGVALALHGLPRATNDIDIWIENKPANIVRLKKVLRAFGFAELVEQIPKIMDVRQALFLGKPPYRLDILSGVSGITFPKAYRDRKIVKLDAMALPLASLKELLKNKQASGRPKDLVDVAAIQRMMEEW
ncbi:MAG: hypothetical protein QM703_24860 [Gemmatales bacterium]